jgi:hypothetical protein
MFHDSDRDFLNWHFTLRSTISPLTPTDFLLSQKLGDIVSLGRGQWIGESPEMSGSGIVQRHHVEFTWDSDWESFI